MARIELIGSLQPIAKYFLDCDRDGASPYHSLLMGFEQFTRVARLNAIWQHENDSPNGSQEDSFEDKYPDVTEDFVDVCAEDDWDLVALIKYTQGDFLTSFIPTGTPFVAFLHNVYWASIAPQMNAKGISTVGQEGCGGANFIFPCVDATKNEGTLILSKCLAEDDCYYKAIALYYDTTSTGCKYYYEGGSVFADYEDYYSSHDYNGSNTLCERGDLFVETEGSPFEQPCTYMDFVGDLQGFADCVSYAYANYSTGGNR